ncbi:enoyl-CoA hydratase/isomerase family protein [Pedobacter xixiisoli]|uniref:Methylglutaconyl-CoA hydratase n=1 Tax=Pedobacter xixiisoli TaxID=1476464 RepID=A0A285ZSV9_9SPHI|nr:enoyl-CoA hydratase-related protein [Pedobacter xixiisoli]SOD12716.1 methylglutaconyl-CoA hydratase [Pedobacter xixiisoli]
MESLVIYQVEQRIAEITINRPDKRNALNPTLVAELTAAFLSAQSDENVKIVVLKANGDVFSAGADLNYMQQLQHFSYEENIQDSTTLKELFETIRTLSKVVVAQVEGHAIAGGCGLATICDIIFAVPEAKFGYTEVKLGFVPAIVSCYLVQKTGETLAKKLLLSGDLFTAEEALKYNLITYVTKSEEINQIVREFAVNLSDNTSGNSLALTKQLINQTSNTWLDSCLNNAIKVNAKTRESDDFKKGISSFLAKEKIKW